MKSGGAKYNTNLASEFWVLSALYRIGKDAQLTLGNKKGVDIVIPRDEKSMITIEVKGLVGPYDWPADNIRILGKPNHFYVLLSFENKISDLLSNPSVWVIPSKELEPFIKQYTKRKDVSRSLIIKNGDKYRNAWELLNI